MKVDKIQCIAIVGAGSMGHGIAQEFALAGYEVRLHDLTKETLQQALKNIQDNLHKLREIEAVAHEQVEMALNNIHLNTILKEATKGVDVVIEAVYEDLALKKSIFHELDKICPKYTILASNTSSFMPSKLAQDTNRPDKVLVTHYFNPPYLLPLVEIVRSERTSDETITTMYDLLVKIGKQPVIVQKEVPGFIGNRLQIALFREAISLVQHGIASPQDVDRVIKTSFGRRLAVAGVFELFEMIDGWDLFSAVCSELLPDLESSSEVSPLLKEKVKRGELGVKTGKGFYTWTPESATALKQRIMNALIQISHIQ